MKLLLRSLLALALGFSFTACLFNEPIFKEGFSKTDAALAGVWAADARNGDPRKMEFAMCAPLDDDRYVLHHPAVEKDSIYYEARPLKIRDRNLLQLRVLATFSDGLPKSNAERYTLLWIEKDAVAETFRVRSLGGDGVKDKGPAQVREFLEKPESDWSTIFGEALSFRRLKDN